MIQNGGAHAPVELTLVSDGITAVASISTIAPGSSSPATTITDIGGK
jgi:hypothetical protein